MEVAELESKSQNERDDVWQRISLGTTDSDTMPAKPRPTDDPPTLPRILLALNDDEAGKQEPKLSNPDMHSTGDKKADPQLPTDKTKSLADDKSPEKVKSHEDNADIRLNGDESKRTSYLQSTLKNLVPVFASINTPDSNLTAQERADRIHKQQREMQDAIDKESKTGVFGPATESAYQQYVSWLGKAVPQTIKELDTLGLSLPPGTPIPLPSDRQGRSIDPQLYKALGADDRLSLDLKLEDGKPPSDAQLDKLDAVYNWLAKANESASEARGKERDRIINKLIQENGLPDTWLRDQNDNGQSGRYSAEEMIDLSMRTRNYIEAMHSLYKTARNSDFPVELPRGARLVIQTKDGETKTIRDNELVDPAVKRTLKDGQIKEVKLDLPLDLRQENPSNKQKIERLREWMSTHGEKIDQAVGELRSLQKNPDAVIMYGDQEVRNGVALFNGSGEFTRIVTDKYKPKAGEETQEMNLVGYNFQVEQIKEGKDSGKYRIRQTIQAEKAPWYAYQNIRAFGVEQLGKPMNVEEKIVDGNDFVPVRSGDKIEIVKAKNLSSFKDGQKLAYFGEKGLSIGMDAAMLASGTIEVGAALRGARMSAVGAHAALKLGTSEAAWQVGKGLARVGIAGAGIFNNAGARDTDWGRDVNTARGIYFLGDIGTGLASTGWNLFRGGKASEAMTAAGKVNTIIHGREALAGAEALKGIPWIRQIHTGAHWTFKATEFGSAPVIISDLKHQVAALVEAGKRAPSVDAVIQLGDGRGLQKVEKGSFDPARPKALEATRQTLDRFSDTLVDGRSKAVRDQVKEICSQTKTLLAKDEDHPDRVQLRQALVEKLSFSPEQIQQLELAHPESSSDRDFKLSNRQLQALTDPEQRKNFPKPVAQLADRMFSEKDKDVQAAAQVALLYLARNKNGDIVSDLATIKSEVPEYKKTIWHPPVGESPGYDEVVTVAARTATQTVTSTDVVRNLKHDLEDPNLGNRGIVTGETLTRIGALTHQQYGGVLQDVLSNQQSTREDRLRALSDSYGPRMATIIDGVRLQESLPKEDSKVGQERATGKSHGLTSEALLAQLEQTATRDKNADVRAMSAALLYGLRDSDPARRHELLNGFNTMADETFSKPGELSKKIQHFLKNESSTDIPENPATGDRVRAARLNAAISLALITDGDDSKTQSHINKTLASSLSPSDYDLSNRVIAALLPNRIQQLQKDDPKLANEFRSAATDLVKRPDSRQRETQVIKLLEQMEQLLKDGDIEIKRQLAGKVGDFLRNSDLNKDYAKHYPQLRAASIDTLSAFGSQDNIELIRAHATAQPSLSLNGKTIAAGEKDASVRMAAVRALEVMRDPMLRPIINDLIDKESDANVGSRLRDIRFVNQRIEPNSREWKELYERTRTDIIGFGKKYPYLDGFNHESAKEWVKENFDLLDRETYTKRAQSAISNATGFWFRASSFKETIFREELGAVNAVRHERYDQWKSLVDMAQKGGEDGNKAKKALYFIATQSGSLMGNKSGAYDSFSSDYDKDYEHQVCDSNWNINAAQELKALAESNCEGKDVVSRAVKDALTGNKEVPSYITLHFIDAWRALGKPDKNGYAIPREELARTTAEALKMELTRSPGNQADFLQKDMINDLKRYGHRMVLPVMEAILDEPDHIKKEVREAATEMLNDFRHSVNMMWRETKVDSTSTPMQRAQRLKGALTDKNNAETTVQEILNAYKGYRIRDDKDPGLPQLQLAMNDTNERVSLVAARVIMESSLPNSNQAKLKAFATLAEMTVTGSESPYRKEAYEALSMAALTPRKPLIIVTGNVIRKIESDDGSTVKITEFTQNQPGKAQLRGFVYPDGSSARWHTDDKGRMTEVWEDGVQWMRKIEGGKHTNDWKCPGKGFHWKGEYTMHANGDYQYSHAGSDKVYFRSATGGGKFRVWSKAQ